MKPKKKSSNQQKSPQRTFIDQARRAQIIEATIEVLAEQGYLNTSFVQIAERAGISPGLISYHFKDKQELTTEVFNTVASARLNHITEKIAHVTTATDKLRIALEADLANMGTRPKLFKALAEILFSMRDHQGALIYMGDLDDPQLSMLQQILEMGQKNGEMGDFNARNLALIIEGARDTFLAQLYTRTGLDLETFTASLLTVVMGAIKNDKK